MIPCDKSDNPSPSTRLSYFHSLRAFLIPCDEFGTDGSEFGVELSFPKSVLDPLRLAERLGCGRGRIGLFHSLRAFLIPCDERNPEAVCSMAFLSFPKSVLDPLRQGVV